MNVSVFDEQNMNKLHMADSELKKYGSLQEEDGIVVYIWKQKEDCMKILVIGGSYFLGRVFTMLAAERHEVTVLNRGTYSMEDFGAKCLKADRHDGEALGAALTGKWDVVVDFCAYQKGDIEKILGCMAAAPKQYIFVSTVDVYRKWTKKALDETAPLEERRFGGEAGEYIRQKILLEKELEECCRSKAAAHTSVRPAVLYGPFNYAPREAVYVQMSWAGMEILCPIGCAGRFQPVYVKDAAAMILALCGNERAFNGAYNLAGEAVDYEGFLDAFREAGGESVRLKKVPVEEALKQKDAFLPFAVTEEETESYIGEKILRDTGLFWTPLRDGLAKTWDVFSKIYRPC